MASTHTNWALVCSEIRTKLVDIVQVMDESLKAKADLSVVAMEAGFELQSFIRALDQDLGGL